jgi:hypothetical protein
MLTVREVEEILDLARQCGATDDSPVDITAQGLLAVDVWEVKCQPTPR